MPKLYIPPAATAYTCVISRSKHLQIFYLKYVKFPEAANDLNKSQSDVFSKLSELIPTDTSFEKKPLQLLTSSLDR